ncbi:lipid A export permease/ATP-binding protein MsbA [Thiohalomonas denitrificans]|uniref:ATP-binding cassette, subfamily B, MsbA n=1 Tax=Thiohalomonas denitrificans TaxID=415747 RepID=A0A1G5R195_9GAMM|nr:lipid A export permease/ATP-binding protein MsbA [Thiohalomonas denitrificans]SCZ67767.1 ATP-binding cassette, subfamily B, MsbA [Thiohalomonas denitrificans]
MASPGTAAAANGSAIYRRLLGYVRPYWGRFLIAVLGMVAVAASETGFVALMKPMLDGSFVERDPTVILWTPIVIILLFLFRGVAAFSSGYVMAWIGRKVISTLRGQIFRHLLKLPVAFFDNTPSGSLVSKLIYDVEQVATAATKAVTILVRDTLTVVGLLGWMFYINWRLAVVLLIGAPLVAKIIHIINDRFRRYSRRIQGSMGDVTQIAQEVIEGQREVKAFGGHDYEERRFEEANEHNRRLNLKLQGTQVASVPVVEFVAASATAAVIYMALSDLDTLTVGAFMSFVGAMMMMHSPMKRLTQVTATLQRGIAAADSVFSFIDRPGENDRGQITLDRAKGEVSYRDLTFRYAEDKPDVLQGIDLQVAPGETVALVGRSGSGKSTLVGLLPRFYDPTSGSIELDGHDIRDIRLDSLREQVALVSQHVTLFNDTIGNNIAYGHLEGADRETIIEATKAAHAWEFIKELPQGLDTMVGENGVLLSGGQRQRLAIARALLKNAPILILDEATSALDTESERHIQAALEVLMKNRTTLVIAHRLSTIEKADRIVVLENGRIIESGHHEALLDKEGRYAALYNMQFQD